MSQYVDNKHGLVVGKNGYFILGDDDAPEGVPQDRDGFEALVWARPFTFQQINSVNVFVETPANQLMWSAVRVMTKDEFDKEPVERTRYVLKNWPQKWLEDNVGALHDAWDVRTYCAKNDRSIFFKKYKDAVAFAGMIEKMLLGMDFM